MGRRLGYLGWPIYETRRHGWKHNESPNGLHSRGWAYYRGNKVTHGRCSMAQCSLPTMDTAQLSLWFTPKNSCLSISLYRAWLLCMVAICKSSCLSHISFVYCLQIVIIFVFVYFQLSVWTAHFTNTSSQRRAPVTGKPTTCFWKSAMTTTSSPRTSPPVTEHYNGDTLAIWCNGRKN